MARWWTGVGFGLFVLSCGGQTMLDDEMGARTPQTGGTESTSRADPPTTPSSPPPTGDDASRKCGNGVLDGAEKCDDGNDVPGDGCDDRCCLEVSLMCYSIPPAPCFCGNGVVDAGEECDDGNTESLDGCDYDCRIGPVGTCGNGVLDPLEECDDGNDDVNDGCFPWCRRDACMPLIPSNPGLGICGDGVIQFDAGEECDDGSNDGGYGECAPGCVIGPYCGDGLVEPGIEECDPGPQGFGQGCSATCQILWTY